MTSRLETDPGFGTLTPSLSPIKMGLHRPSQSRYSWNKIRGGTGVVGLSGLYLVVELLMNNYLAYSFFLTPCRICFPSRTHFHGPSFGS